MERLFDKHNPDPLPAGAIGRKGRRPHKMTAMETPRYRCDNCGNKTRFDVVGTESFKAFYHYSLGGELTIESREVTEFNVESVTCRWCGSTKAIVDDAAAEAQA